MKVLAIIALALLIAILAFALWAIVRIFRAAKDPEKMLRNRRRGGKR